MTLDDAIEFRGRADCHGLYSAIGTSLGSVTTRKAGVPDGSYALGRIVITPDEMTAIRSEIACTCSAYDRLERERSEYIRSLGLLPSTCESDYPDGIEDPTYWQTKRSELNAVEARDQAIKAWDGQHPEHTRERKERQAAETARFINL